MVMENPSPLRVGTEFVRQYYTMMHESPGQLHRFFSRDSQFIHGGIDKPGEEQASVTGQLNIHKKIMSLNLRDCRTKIRQVDSQTIPQNMVVVQVAGELSNNSEPMRRFMQTFILAQQSPKKYYVCNNIFRFQDEVFLDDSDVENMEGQGQETDTTEAVMDHNNEEAETPSFWDDQVQASLSNGSGHEEKAEPEVVVVIEEIPELVPEPETVVVVEKVEEEELPIDIQQDETTQEEEELEPEPPVAAAPEPPKHFSWAELASKGTGKESTVQSDVLAAKPVARLPSSPKVPEPKPETAPPPQPQAQRPARPARFTSGRGDEDGGSMRQSKYPDEQQLFIGNLNTELTEGELQTFFADFGKVMELRINRNNGPKNVPNFGFVVFETREQADAVLNAKPLMYHGHRINVEAKRNRSMDRPVEMPRTNGTGGRGMRGGIRGGARGRGGNMGAPRGERAGAQGPRGGSYGRQ